jgi:hypothetical protein
LTYVIYRSYIFCISTYLLFPFKLISLPRPPRRIIWFSALRFSHLHFALRENVHSYVIL